MRKVQTKPTCAVSIQKMLVRCDLFFDDAQRKAWNTDRLQSYSEKETEEFAPDPAAPPRSKNTTPDSKVYP